MQSIYNKYAKLLVNYSLEVKKGDKVYIVSSYLAEPLLKEVAKEILIAGGHPEFKIEFESFDKIRLDYSQKHQLEWVSPFRAHALTHFDCYIYIRAPFNLKDLKNVDPEKRKIAKAASADLSQVYSQRTASRELRRNLCLFPTLASAQEANMSLDEFQDFVFKSCFLYEDDPTAHWLNIRKYQQEIVDLLNTKNKIQYKGEDIDITFSTDNRTWINSDGQTNMPSGEVYTSPVENTVNGNVRFSFPGIFMGEEIEDISLSIKDGEVVKWEAKRGQKLLDTVLKIPGANRFGEIAIGTNKNIQTFTKNMLFDEKMGGTIHMALGQSYLQTGGKNQSSIHWDLLANMKNGGEIYADDELIYKAGEFLFLN